MTEKIELVLPELEDTLFWASYLKRIGEGSLTFSDSDCEKIASFLNGFTTGEEQDLVMKVILIYSIQNHIDVSKNISVNENDSQ